MPDLFTSNNLLTLIVSPLIVVLIGLILEYWVIQPIRNRASKPISSKQETLNTLQSTPESVKQDQKVLLKSNISLLLNEIKYIEWKLWRNWMFASIIAYYLSLIIVRITYVNITLNNRMLLEVLSATFSALTFGIVQWLVLRRYIKLNIAWIFTSSFWIIGFLLFRYGDFAFPISLIYGFMIGFVQGLLQALILDKHFLKRQIWVAANAISFSLWSMLISDATWIGDASIVPLLRSLYIGLYPLIVGTIVGLVFAWHSPRLNSFNGLGKDKPTVSSYKIDNTVIIALLSMIIFISGIMIAYRFTTPLPSHMLEVGESVSKSVFSPDGSKLAVGLYNGEVDLWDVKQGIHLFSIKGHDKAVISIVFSPDGKKLVTGSWDETVKLWSTTNGDLINTLGKHLGTVYSLSFSKDGQVLATGSSDETVKLWQITNGALIRTLEGFKGTIVSLLFKSNDQILVSAEDEEKNQASTTFNETSTIYVKRITDGLDLQVFTIPFTKVVFYQNGQLLAAFAGNTNVIDLWDIPTEKLLQRNRLRDFTIIQDAEFSPSGLILALALDQEGTDFKGAIWLWQTNDNDYKKIKSPCSVDNVVFSPVGTNLAASCSREHLVIIWPLNS